MAPLLLAVVSLVTVDSALAARIIGITGASSGSHYFVVKKTMEELSSRGHEVVLVLPSTEKESRSDEKIPHKIVQVPFDRSEFGMELVVKTAIEEGMFRALIKLNEFQRVVCEQLLNNTELLQELRNFDLIVYEASAACSVLVSHLLDIPHVVIFPFSPNIPRSSYFKIPLPLSYVPLHVMTTFTSKMSFTQRLMNVGLYVFYQFALHFMFERSMVPLKEKYNIAPEISCSEAVANFELLIIAADFALEYPQPLLPGHIMVGPITAQAKPNPLPLDLVDFINSAGENGFIIASFGSYAQTIISKAKIDVLGMAFGKLKQNVIWKLTGYIPSYLSANVKVVSWLPQNDLLAHKNIKAFVSHAGHNSFYESSYHGVPLVVFPLCCDQISIATKVKHFGLGVALDLHFVNVQELLEAVQLVVNEVRFKSKAMRISRLLKDSPRTPLEKTGDWIEYVLRHDGARHLRAQVFDIPWYQYYLLDVIAFLVAMATLVAMVIKLMCRCLCNVRCRQSNIKTKKE